MGIRTGTLVLVVALPLVLACTPASRPSDDAQALLKAQAEQKGALQCEPGKEHWRAQGAPKRGGVMKAEHENPVLDPTAPGGRSYYHNMIYEYLVKPRSCYFADTEMIPDLAKSWEVSPNGLTWTLKIRENVRYQNKPPLNGRPFTSADVGWTIDYLVKESDLKGTFDGIAHEEPDAQTVILKFSNPDPDFIYKLGDERLVMLPREIKEQMGDFKTYAVGTGPFMLKEYKSNQYTISERNPDYYAMGADGKPLPYLDEAHAINFADPAATLTALRAGQIDHEHGAQVRKIDQDQLKQANLKYRYYADPAATVHGLWLNPKVAPWNDVRVRRAMSLAIDRDDLIAADGGGAIEQGFVPQVLGDLAWPLEKVKSKFKANPEEAKRLLKEAGFTQSGDYSFTTGTNYGQQIEVVAKQLENVGVKTRIQVGPGNASGPLIRDFAARDLSWGPPGGGRFPDYWVGDLVRTGAGRNVAQYGDPKLDTLIDAQKKELDPAKRKAVIDQIQDYMYDQMPYVPTVSRLYYGVLACRIKNMYPNHNSLNYWGFQHAWIDETDC